jgi:hypothetical protein
MKKLIIPLLALVFGSCSDASKDEMIVKGLILSADNKKGMSNIPVSIELSNEGITDYGPNGADGKIYFVNPVLISTVSNASGQFLFKVDPRRYKYYRIRTSEQFMEVNNQSDFIAELTSSKVIIDTLFVAAASNLKIILKNDIVNDGDQISITLPHDNPYTTDRIKFYYAIHNDLVGSLGKPKTEAIFNFQFLSDFNKSATVNISVTRDQQTLFSTKEILLKNQETTEYTIVY